jgi:hypothetical protein
MSEQEKQPPQLTEEHKRLIGEYYERFQKYGTNTDPCDRDVCNKAIRAFYKYCGKPEPEIYWTQSPYESAVLAAKLVNQTETPSKEEIRAQMDRVSYGSFDSYWLSFYKFAADHLPVEKDELIDIAVDLVKEGGSYIIFEEAVIVSEKPKTIHINDQGELHHETEKALEYRDGTGLFALKNQVYASLLEARMELALGSTETPEND